MIMQIMIMHVMMEEIGQVVLLFKVLAESIVPGGHGDISKISISSSPTVPSSLSDGQTRRFSIYLTVDPSAPTQHFDVRVAMLGSLSGTARPIYDVIINWVNEDCVVSSYTPALNTFCGTRNVVTNCGTTVSMTGTLPCVAPNTCVNNACQACVVSSYTPALNTFCGTRSVATNCGTTVSMTGTLPCVAPNTCVNNACQACVVSSYTPALNTFCGR